jgi:hypothetical protein
LIGRRRRETWVERTVGHGHKVALLVMVAALLAAAALLGVASATGLSPVLHLLRHPGWGWLGIALLAEAAAYLGYTFAYRGLVRVESGPELEVPKAAALVATGFGVFLQGGGFALDREALRRAGLPEQESRTIDAQLLMPIWASSIRGGRVLLDSGGRRFVRVRPHPAFYFGSVRQ